MVNIKSIYYIHIPKTAGTSIEKIFYENGGCVSSCFFRKYNKSIIKNKKYNNISLWHIPLQFLNQEFINNILENKIIFAIVRNPYERIISDFKFWIQYYNERLSKFNKKQLNNKEKYLMISIKKLYNNDYTINKTNLNKFINNILNKTDLYTLLDGHFIPMIEYVLVKGSNNKLKVFPNKILKIEDLNNEFNDFINSYQLNIPLNSAKKTKNNITKDLLSIKDLNNESINLINKIYIYDFKFFKYKKL
jgi:hypothetical protein